MSGQDEQGKIESAVSNISKGVDKKEDTMMLMAPEANWDQFLTPAPFAIALLGDLIIISAGTDFSLEEKPPKDGFKHLRYPNSFRASLVQVSNSGWDAFNEAHTSMDQIRLHSLNVDTHVKNAVKFLLKGSPEEVEQMLPLSLNKIDKIANESLQLAQNIENRFVFVMQLTAELLEACTNTKGVYDSKAKETETAIRVAKLEQEAVLKEEKAMKSRLEKMEKDVTEAQADFKDAVKSIPSGADMLLMSAAEAMIEGVRNLTSVASIVKGVGKKKARQLLFDDSDTEDEDETPENLDISMSKQKVYLQIEIISKHINQLAQIVWGSGDATNPKPDFTAISKDQSVKEIEQILNRCQNNVQRETKCKELSKQVSQFCVKGKQICEKMISMTKQITTENNENKIASISEEVNSLRNDLEKRAVVARKKLGKNPLDNKPPHLAKMPTQSKSGSAVQAAREDARFKVDLAKETLKDAKQRQDKAFEELKETNDRLTKVLKEMETLDIQKIDFDIIRDTLVKGINALAAVREQWGKLVRFFQMLSNLIKCCLHASLKDFVDTANVGRGLSLGGKPLSDCYRDVIFEQATQANKVAYVVHTIAKTYVQVSEQHLMDRITCLGQLIALDPKKDEHEIQQRRHALYNGCRKAQDAIKALVSEEKENFHRQIEARIARIDKEVGQLIPALPPAREAEIQNTVESGFNMADEEIEDMV